MTGQSSLFSSYTPYTGLDKVKIVYGTFSSIFDKCLVHTTPSLSLSSVLHVSSIASNLLSIIRITRDLNYNVTFFSSSYVFQDLQMRMTIDSGRETNGQYFLHLPTSTQGQLSVVHHTFISPSTEETIWLWHRRLGHLSFHLIQHLLPFLLPSSFVSLFQCKSYKLGKHHHFHFPIRSYTTKVHFSIVHSDIWSPSKTVKSYWA